MIANTATAVRDEFLISRVFDAPRDLVWKAWTQGERLAQWWGPKGCEIRVAKLDMRESRIFHYAMEFQPGATMWGRFIYREIAAPERLVFINSFSDEKGGVTRAPFPQLNETWPLEILNTMTLAENDGKTTLTLRASPIDATAEEHKTFTGMFDSMRQGYGGTFDKLTDYLAKAKI